MGIALSVRFTLWLNPSSTHGPPSTQNRTTSVLKTVGLLWEDFMPRVTNAICRRLNPPPYLRRSPVCSAIY
ncbi:hypothetical protein B0H13DRAFT_2069909 [Mycena leptocephala]|nr:hypothetical protein B0H13DRAFT_2069909 [Mycena leptocephala]